MRNNSAPKVRYCAKCGQVVKLGIVLNSLIYHAACVPAPPIDPKTLPREHAKEADKRLKVNRTGKRPNLKNKPFNAHDEAIKMVMSKTTVRILRELDATLSMINDPPHHFVRHGD